MSLGAGKQFERRVVVDLRCAVGPLREHATVPVARVLAQTEVRDHDQLGVGLLDRARGELDDPLVIPRAGALLVLAGRQPEQQHGGDAERVRLPGLLHRVGDRQLVDARHRRDRVAPVDPVRDEHRVDEVAGVKARLAHQAPERMSGPEPAQAGLRERHQTSQGIGGRGAEVVVVRTGSVWGW
jgi:hypothetical protein